MNEFQIAIAERAHYEHAKSSENTSMQDTCAKLVKSFAHESIAELLRTSNVNADFINRNERVNAKYNVYAAEKVANVARYLVNAAMLNHYTLAIVRACVALEAEEMLLTHRDASIVCSMKYKHSDAKREKILKNARYAKHTELNTAATQSSSSINALQTFNVLVESRDASNTACYKLNRDNAATQALLAKIAQ